MIKINGNLQRIVSLRTSHVHTLPLATWELLEFHSQEPGWESGHSEDMNFQKYVSSKWNQKQKPQVLDAFGLFTPLLVPTGFLGSIFRAIGKMWML